MIEPTWVSDDHDIKLYLGDCIDVMQSFPDNSFDAIVTDPPYGVNVKYNSFEDTESNLRNLINKFMPEFRRLANITLLTPGQKNMCLYPPWNWMLAIVEPAGVGVSSWGFTCWHSVLAYGKCQPHLTHRMGSRPDVLIAKNTKREVSTDIHPCPKPVSYMDWLVDIATAIKGKTVLDPFMGSGSTGISCVKSGQKFVGIELDEDYFFNAVLRIEEELKNRGNDNDR